MERRGSSGRSNQQEVRGDMAVIHFAIQGCRVNPGATVALTAAFIDLMSSERFQVVFPLAVVGARSGIGIKSQLMGMTDSY